MGYVSWVQNVVRQFGPYLLRVLKIEGISCLVREDCVFVYFWCILKRDDFYDVIEELSIVIQLLYKMYAG